MLYGGFREVALITAGGRIHQAAAVARDAPRRGLLRGL